MVILKCQRCGYKWNYHGKSEWYAPCSRCKTSVNIKKQKIKIEEKKSYIKKNICSICGKNKTKFEMANEDICLNCSNNIIEGMNIFEKDKNLKY
ncbi:hypothetical protein ACFL1L_03110 [Thermoplasmatota archaeon]